MAALPDAESPCFLRPRTSVSTGSCFCGSRGGPE